MKNKRGVGTEYEAKAASYLEGLGYTVLERNFRCRSGEVDIVAAEAGTLVFVEVKYRRDNAFGEPEEAVDFRKQHKICRTADYYRITHGVPEGRPCRFDVVAVSGTEVRLIKDAFMYR